jgi:hypothetical protein
MKAPMVLTPLVSFVILSLVAAAGCQRSHLTTGVSDSTFVDVMASLKRVHDAPGLDSGRRAVLRDSILQSRDLTPAQLDAAARRLAQNPARAQTVWQAVERRASDTAGAKPRGPAAAK